jgi:membrane fusion protein (multidrug efflux system)
MKRNRIFSLIVCLAGLGCHVGFAQELTTVVAKAVSRTVELPGEFLPFEIVSLHAKVPGYVERVLVDRGSVVKEGDLLVELTAPEMGAQIAEAESKVQSSEADRLQAEAQLAGTQSTYDRLKRASETPGAIAGNGRAKLQKQPCVREETSYRT